MNEWTNERTNEWMKEWMNEWMNDWMTEWMKEWMNERTNEWMKEGMNEWSNDSLNFADLIFQMCSDRDSFWTCSSANQPLATVLWTFCGPLLQIEATLLQRPQKPLYPKNTGFCARVCFQAGNHAFPTWWCGWHDDMMMWLTLTWWWQCWPWQPSVARKFSLIRQNLH